MLNKATMDSYHKPVMLEEAIEGLNLVPGGIYVDCTFGGGGHSEKILEKLAYGHLYAFDQDPDAAGIAKSIANKNFHFIESNFKYLHRYLKMYGVEEVNGLLADLGVSSHQIDDATRGFSTRFDHTLNMRMDQGSGLTALDILNQYSEKELRRIFSQYGEIREAAGLARVITNSGNINGAEELKELLKRFAPRGREMKFFAKVFQALRIEVNQEMNALETLLLKSTSLVKKGGRMVVISYHSLEDRLVKNFFNTGNLEGTTEKDFYGNLIRPFTPVTRKPLIPDEDEISINKRSRSAKMRVAEKN